MSRSTDQKPVEIRPERENVRPEKRSSIRGEWLSWAVKLLVSAGLLFFLFRIVDPEEILRALREAKTGWLLAAFLLVPLNLVIQAARWRLFVSTELKDVPFHRAFSSLLGGFAIGLITPGRIGEVGRVFLLKAPSRIRLTGLHVLDKMYTFGAVSFSGPLLLYLFPGFREALPPSLSTGLGIFVAVLPLVYLYIALDPRPLKSLMLGIQLVLPNKPRVLEALRAYDGIRTVHTAGALALTAAQLAVIFTQFFLITNAFQPVNWLVAAHTYDVVLFVKSVLPVSLGSLGIGEWAAVSLYERYGIANTAALSSSLLLFGMNVLLPAMAGLVILLRTHSLIRLSSALNQRSEAA